MSLSTHVLDLSSGRPAVGVGITLDVRAADGAWWQAGQARTDADGRVRDLGDEELTAGVYRLTFDVGAYFGEQGVASFHPEAAVTFEIANPDEHHHVPLLVSPFGYTTYRGS